MAQLVRKEAILREIGCEDYMDNDDLYTIRVKHLRDIVKQIPPVNLTVAEDMQWRSINEALPKNGQRVLVAGKNTPVQIMTFDHKSRSWLFGGNLFDLSRKQYWMAIPEPPEIMDEEPEHGYYDEEKEKWV